MRLKIVHALEILRLGILFMAYSVKVSDVFVPAKMCVVLSIYNSNIRIISH